MKRKINSFIPKNNSVQQKYRQLFLENKKTNVPALFPREKSELELPDLNTQNIKINNSDINISETIDVNINTARNYHPIQVAIRVRPIPLRELKQNCESCIKPISDTKIVLIPPSRYERDELIPQVFLHF